jgi:hypothetical protein
MAALTEEGGMAEPAWQFEQERQPSVGTQNVWHMYGIRVQLRKKMVGKPVSFGV